jgi:hypothetical protein
MLRIAADPQDLVRLEAVAAADWVERGSLAVGTTALGQVHWCAGEAAGTVHLLVGEDDETWDLALTLPAALVAEIVLAARGATAGEQPPDTARGR